MTSDREYVAQTAALLSARAVRNDLPQGTHVAARDALELHRIATRMHRWDERNCNEDLGCRVCEGEGRIKTLNADKDFAPEYKDCKACAGKGHTLGRREARAEARALDIARPYGLRVYLQGDCRGCPLYLIPNETCPNCLDNPGHKSIGMNAPPCPTCKGYGYVVNPADDHANYSSRGVAVCHLGR